MNINRQKLVELIAEESGLTVENIDGQLSELITRIEDSSEKGKALEIKDFGMFYRSEEGEVTFEPSEELETEVNFRYAGMEPIEIRKSLTPDSKISDEDTDDTALADYEDIDSEPVPVAPIEEKAGTTAANGFKKPAGSEESGIFNRKQRDRKPVEESELKSERNPAAALITTFVTLLVIVIGIIILIDVGFFDGMFERAETDDSGMTAMTGTVPQVETSGGDAEVTAPVVSGDSEPGSAGVEAGDTEPEPVSELSESSEMIPPAGSVSVGTDETETAGFSTPVPAENPEQPAGPDSDSEFSDDNSTYGLSGDIQMIDTVFYTIVVHSFRDESVAREQAATLENDGYRAITLQADLSELGQRWRVGIGQFESIRDAGEVAENLPDSFTDNYFIGIIK